jgi:putative peptide maturation dehydrogenase
MRVRRCSILMIEAREQAQFDFDSLLSGGNGLRAERQWVALAPHLKAEVPLSTDELLLLGSVPTREWSELETIACHDPALLGGLVAKGLLIADPVDVAVNVAEMRTRDDALRASHWHPLAAVAHAFARWQGVAAGDMVRNIGMQSVVDLVDKLGAPPAHFHSRSAAAVRVKLAPPQPTAIDALLRRRATCRNFDCDRALPQSIFSHVLKRTFGAQAQHDIDADTAILKKTSPSAGGLHPTEAYLLIQHVEGVAPGLYHYHVGDHALEPLQLLAADAALVLAGRFLAQQHWFARAHALVVLVPRFTRSFWKYRNHAKVYRAVTLDVGHLSQTLQVSATEFGLGAFVTSAINDVDIEQALGLAAMQESPLAVCGFGWRASVRSRMEFDPQHAVWPG